MINWANYIRYVDNFWTWYMLTIFLGVIILYHNLIKKEWERLRIERKICYSGDISFQYRKLWFVRNALKIFATIFVMVLVFNLFLVDETDFESKLTLIQKVRNIVPVLIFYLSLSYFTKVSIKENSAENLDKLIILFMKFKNEKLTNLIEKEIFYINQQNKKIIHKITQSNLNEWQKTNEEHECGRINKKLLYILLEFSACDEFESKHKYEIKAFQSDEKQQEFLNRVISIRASLVGEKPYFSDKEFDYLCTGILPEIGISYSDIYTTIRRINRYKIEIINRDVEERDLYFKKKFIQNNESNDVITNDSFDQEIEAVFCADEDKEILCTTVDNH